MTPCSNSGKQAALVLTQYHHKTWTFEHLWAAYWAPRWLQCLSVHCGTSKTCKPLCIIYFTIQRPVVVHRGQGFFLFEFIAIMLHFIWPTHPLPYPHAKNRLPECTMCNFFKRCARNVLIYQPHESEKNGTKRKEKHKSVLPGIKPRTSIEISNRNYACHN